ncbi:hypothetical protein GCM10011344_00140 [Dokdonia pacifica]|uniref:Import receptor subunit TOM20 n=1 Tax=Dokdonia pacifica TaxID=1627892 RepID=A0A239D3P3_9FLAO|nr:SIR2 family protein [Dokdonia pacifica]GGG03785.1 hypothetical protein GCM10011344_00140 [Dokdonia pacifica]SNS26907.1 import receptor subunit TOM20 [Dokdonia pacifica]
MSETNIPVELRQAISENKLIIFVGAGLSYDLKNRKGQTIKGWGNLVKEIIIQLQAKGHNIDFLLPLLNVYEPIEVLHLIEKHPDFSKETIYDIATEFLELDDSQNDYSLHQKLNTLSKKIITTNYDEAFERAVPSLDKNKAHNGRNHKLNKFTNPDLESLLKLHGCIEDQDNIVLFPSNYKKLYKPSKKSLNEKYILEALKRIINTNSILFIGAGMGDFQINNIFKKIKKIQQGYGKKHFIITNKPLDSSLDFLTLIKKKHIEINDFIDELLEIKKQCKSPKSEKEKELEDQIREYEIRIKELESKTTSDATTKELLEEEALKYFTKGLKHQLSGKFEKAFKQYKKSLRLTPNNHRTYNNWGNALGNLAQTKQGSEAEKLFAQAFEKYKKAIEIKPDFHLAFCSWGSDLGNLATIKQGQEAETLFQLAVEKSQKAINIQPDYYLSFYNCGTALGYIAETKQGKEADQLYQQAFEKYQKTIELQPDYHQAFNNWGNDLNTLARNKEGEEAEILFQQAIEKYKKAIEIKPNKYGAYNNWGNALSDLAKTKQGKEADQFYQQAFEKYQKAIDIKPDDHSAFNNWGDALISHAFNKKGKDEILKEAYQKCKKGYELGSSPYNLACVLALQNKKEEALKYLELAIRNYNQNINFIHEDPDWKDYLEDPDFLAIIEKYK